MSNLLKMMAGSAVEPLYVDDVFSAYTYTGNGSTQTITNGIDLAGKGGMVWGKGRSTSGYNNTLMDTVRTGTLFSDTTQGNGDYPSELSSFNSNGFTTASGASYMNGNGVNFVSWTFRNAPKFFDIVTYTGDGVAGKQIAHSLGIAPGMIVIKRTDAAGGWMVYHRSATGALFLNETYAQDTANMPYYFGNDSVAVAPTSSAFTLGSNGNGNQNAATYIAYLFAHDTGADGMIQCGITDASGNFTLGWEPQWILGKTQTDAADNWALVDTTRVWAVETSDAYVFANLSNAELGNGGLGYPTATGFVGYKASSIFVAIRRPNKPPTVGTQVYNAIARTGTGAAATVTGVGFAPDLALHRARLDTVVTPANMWQDRLRGISQYLKSNNTNGEFADTAGILSLTMDGMTVGTDTSEANVNINTATYINHFFRRAPGVFDEVCYTGTGAAHTEAHNLGAVPELMIVKGRSGATQWEVYSAALANTEKLILNSTAAKATDTASWNSTTPTATVLTVGTGANVNTNTATYVAYLFATLAGISKVGSYTGNGSSLTINCGFTTGARFILIKRTDSTGDWYMWDTVRGIIAGNDPHLSLNTTAAEVTSDDSIDPDTSGFIVNQLAATNVNVTSATYIFLAYA